MTTSPAFDRARAHPRWRATLPLLLTLILSAPAGAASIAIACGSVGVEADLCREGAQAWAARSGHSVSIVSTPNDANERLALFLQLLAARSPDVDVLQIDVVWSGMLAPFLIDLAPSIPEGTLAESFKVLVESNRVDGRLVALPWFADVGLLYYRRDILDRYGAQVPRQWRQLTALARDIQARERARGHSRLWGFVWQGRAYEGLTCNALEWVHSAGGGTIVEHDGRISIDNPAAAQALTLASSWVGTITPSGVLNYTEEEARAVFQSGDALFMRNWPYALALASGPASAVAGRIGIAPLPSGNGGSGAGALGGSQLAVSRYSRAPAAAIDLVRALTSAEEQKRRALVGGLNPAIERLYRDPELLAAAPWLGELHQILAGAVARPSAATGRRYNQVSNEFWNAVHDVLSGRAAAAASLAALAQRLRFLSRGEQW
jgi:trehalose/maltose transport system substrate-binding protein